MAWFYWLPNLDILGSICDIPHRPLWNNCCATLFFPRTRKCDCKKIFLAANDYRNYCSRSGCFFNIAFLKLSTKPKCNAFSICSNKHILLSFCKYPRRQEAYRRPRQNIMSIMPTRLYS